MKKIGSIFRTIWAITKWAAIGLFLFTTSSLIYAASQPPTTEEAARRAELKIEQAEKARVEAEREADLRRMISGDVLK